MDIDIQALASEITNDPAGLGYAGKNYEQVTDMLKAENRTVVPGTIMLTLGDIYQLLGFTAGLMLMEGLRNSTHPTNAIAHKEAARLLDDPSGRGVDIGEGKQARLFLDQLVLDGMLDTTNAGKLKGHNVTTTSRVEEIRDTLKLKGRLKQIYVKEAMGA